MVHVRRYDDEFLDRIPVPTGEQWARVYRLLLRQHDSQLLMKMLGVRGDDIESARASGSSSEGAA